MKKLFGFMTCLAVLLAGVMFTGCDEVEDELAGPENTWCELPVYITASEANGDQPDMYLDVIYVPAQVSGTSGSSNLKTSITLEPGITVVASAKVDIESLGMTAGSYTIKTFPLNATANDSTDNDSYTFAGTKAKWTAIYWAKKDLRNTTTQTVLPKAPAAITNSSSYAELTNLSSFNWKALLASYLLN